MTPRKYAHPLHFSATGNRKLIAVLGWYVHMSFQDINYPRFLQFSTCVYLCRNQDLKKWNLSLKSLERRDSGDYELWYFIMSFLFFFSQLRKAAKVKEKRNWERFAFTFKVACVVGAQKKELGAQERNARGEGACSLAHLPPMSRSFLHPLHPSLLLRELCHEIFLN